MTAEGSRSAAPVIMPGPSLHTVCQDDVGLGGWGGAGKRTSFPRSSGDPLRDLGKLTVQVPFDLALVPEPQRSSVGDQSISGDGRQEQTAADTQEDIGGIRLCHFVNQRRTGR